MPSFEYVCRACDLEFEELLLHQDEIREYSKSHPCPECKQPSLRSGVQVTNFSFKAPARQGAGTGVHGQSGVHDLDYPKLDKAVGRSSDVKWDRYGVRKAARDKARRELGTNSVTQVGDTVMAASPGTLAVREKALIVLERAKKTAVDE